MKFFGKMLYNAKALSRIHPNLYSAKPFFFFLNPTFTVTSHVLRAWQLFIG